MPRRLLVALLGFAAVQANAQPRVFLVDLNTLNREQAVLGADKIRGDGPFSVMQKARAAPSGDKHDYMSQAPYFWPNPATPDHLPYVRRDGERNPEINAITDHANMDRMSKDARTLALAYFVTHDEVYASRAALLLRAWFENPATRMNPNLNFAQAVPGVNDGRGIGIIESRGLTSVVDAIGLLNNSANWTVQDQAALESWFTQFLLWLQESSNGRDEAKAQNNHGTFYDVQIADFALFTGQKELSARTLEQAKQKRIEPQIERDGRQPKETDRTKGLSYSAMNLEGMFDLASLGEHAGVDLWNFESKHGGGIRKALDWLVPYATGDKKWPYQQIDAFQASDLVPLLRIAAVKYHEGRYLEIAGRLEKK